MTDIGLNATGTSFFDSYTDAEIVWAYSRLLMISEPRLAVLLAQVPVAKTTTDLGTIAAAIRSWCLVGVKPLEADIYPATVEENVEDYLTTPRLANTDVVVELVAAFHEAVKWNTPAK